MNRFVDDPASRVRPLTAALAALATAALPLVLGGCSSAPTSAELDAQTAAMMKASFRDQGIATADRLKQDLAQSACSSDAAPSETVAKAIEAEAMATIRWPSNAQYVGDWRAGERIAQSGRGMTWSDASAAAAGNGGNCYNCHQIAKAEISFGTIGPSLYQYGKLRGVKAIDDPAAAAIIQYTWGKLWNAKAYTACSNMPRFGQQGMLNEAQLRDVMALLLDPSSPVNQ